MILLGKAGFIISYISQPKIHNLMSYALMPVIKLSVTLGQK